MLLLRRLREAAGLSRAELARRARIHPSDLSRTEAGRLRPYDVQLRRLARALRLPAARSVELLEDVDGGG